MSAPYLLLGFAVLPLWIAAGFVDYLCHRAARISENSGVPESFLHLVQFSLLGIPVALGLFVQATAGYFLLAGIFILLHHLAAYLDVRYANGTRTIAPREQMVHSFLEILPIAAWLLLAAAEWPRFLSLFGYGDSPPVFALQPRLIFAPYTTAILTAAFLFNLIPYLEEFRRCWKARKKTQM